MIGPINLKCLRDRPVLCHVKFDSFNDQQRGIILCSVVNALYPLQVFYKIREATLMMLTKLIPGNSLSRLSDIFQAFFVNLNN